VTDAGASFSVVICTRNRPELLARTLDALEGQTRVGFRVLVIDQSDQPDRALEARAGDDRGFEVIHDQGRGLSRSRNIGWNRAESPWVAYLDDDCVPDPDWAAELEQAIGSHPDVSFISGSVRPDAAFEREVPLTTTELTEEKTFSGRRVKPDALGFGAFCAVKREWLARLDGWDERLGTGTDFPGSDDMDFNYRFLREGGVALVTPRLRVVHEQWRTPQEELAVWQGYCRGWAAMTVKQLRGGDVSGGLLMSFLALRTVAGVVWGSLRMRSVFQLRKAASMSRGLLAGAWRAAAIRW
jgi:glycosyltransferase involved in cell wall biosynthesis